MVVILNLFGSCTSLKAINGGNSLFMGLIVNILHVREISNSDRSPPPPCWTLVKISCCGISQFGQREAIQLINPCGLPYLELFCFVFNPHLLPPPQQNRLLLCVPILS